MRSFASADIYIILNILTGKYQWSEELAKKLISGWLQGNPDSITTCTPLMHEAWNVQTKEIQWCCAEPTVYSTAYKDPMKDTSQELELSNGMGLGSSHPDNAGVEDPDLDLFPYADEDPIYFQE